MTAMVLRWRQSPPTIVLRWRGPDGRVLALAAPDQPTPVASVIAPAGPPGVPSAPFMHTQASAAIEWVVNHNLGWEPQVSVLSPGGALVDASVVHTTTAQLRIHFSAPRSGRATLR